MWITTVFYQACSCAGQDFEKNNLSNLKSSYDKLAKRKNNYFANGKTIQTSKDIAIGIADT